MPKRIAISGSAGTGKSTLARRLAAELGLPYIGEGMREYLERTGRTLHDVGHDGLRDLILTLWEERRAAEAAAPDGFVADRGAYDYAAFWMYYHLAAWDPATDDFMAEVLSPRRYDHIYVLPWGAIPLVADGVRSPNPWTQLHLQLLIEGVLKRHAPEAVDVRAVALDDRLAELLADLRGGRG